MCEFKQHSHAWRAKDRLIVTTAFTPQRGGIQGQVIARDTELVVDILYHITGAMEVHRVADGAVFKIDQEEFPYLALLQEPQPRANEVTLKK